MKHGRFQKNFCYFWVSREVRSDPETLNGRFLATLEMTILVDGFFAILRMTEQDFSSFVTDTDELCRNDKKEFLPTYCPFAYCSFFYLIYPFHHFPRPRLSAYHFPSTSFDFREKSAKLSIRLPTFWNSFYANLEGSIIHISNRFCLLRTRNNLNVEDLLRHREK